jgi:hypothetical protein
MLIKILAQTLRKREARFLNTEVLTDFDSLARFKKQSKTDVEDDEHAATPGEAQVRPKDTKILVGMGFNESGGFARKSLKRETAAGALEVILHTASLLILNLLDCCGSSIAG